MTPQEQQALTQASQAILNGARDLVSVLNSITAQTGSAGNSVSKAVKTLSSAISDSVPNLQHSLENLTQNINSGSADVDVAYNRQLDAFNKRLNKETQFFSRDATMDQEVAKRKALDLKRQELQSKQLLQQARTEGKAAKQRVKDAEQAQIDALNAAGGPLPREVQEQLTAAIESAQADVSKLAGAMRVAKNSLHGNAVALQAAEAKVRSLDFAVAAEKAGEGVETWMKGTWSAFIGFLRLNAGAAFYDIFKTMRTEMSRQGSIDDTNGRETAALGLKRSEFAEMAGEYRRTMMAMGGVHRDAVTGEVKSIELLKYAQTELYKQTGDMALATKGGMLAYDAMARNGINPTKARLKQFAETAKEVQTMAGVTLEQYASMQNDMLDDESTQIAMRMANSEDERANIQANIQARIKENLAMGMTTTQALSAAKALGKMGAEGPMERYKKSMKLQMAMGAMGVGGGEEAARIYRKPEHLRTAEEKRALTGSMSNYSNALSTQQGSEDMGTAMVAEQIGNKSGFDEQSVSMFNTKAIEPLKAKLGENTNELAKLNKAFSGGIYDMLQGWDWAKSMLTNSPVIAITAGIASLGIGMFALGSKMSILTAALGSAVAAIKTSSVFGGKGAPTPSLPGAPGDSKGGGMMGGLADGLAKLSNPKLFIGVAVLGALTIPLWAAGKALQEFAGVEWGSVGKGMATMAGLGAMAAALSFASAPMLIGAAAIGVLGGAMWVAGKAMQEFATAFTQFAEVKWEALGTGLGLFGAGLGELWSKAPNPLFLAALAGGIGYLGLALIPMQSSAGIDFAAVGQGLGVFGQGLADLYEKAPITGMIPLAGALALFGAGLRPLSDNLVGFDTDKLGSMTDRLSQLSQLDAKNLGAVAQAMGQINANMSPTVIGAITSVATGVWDKLTGTAKPAAIGGDSIGSEMATESKSDEGESKEEKNRKEMAINEQLKKMDDTNGHLSTVSTDIKQLVDLANKQLVVSTLSDAEKKDSRKKITGDSSGFSASSYSYI